MEVSALKKCLYDRIRENDKCAHAWNCNEVHEPKPERNTTAQSDPALSRELRSQQRKNNRSYGRCENLVRKIDQLRRVVHACHVAWRERRGEVTVEEERDLPGSAANDDRTE